MGGICGAGTVCGCVDRSIYRASDWYVGDVKSHKKLLWMELDMFHSQEFFAAYIKLHALLLLFVLLSYIFRCAGDLRIKSPKYCAIY